MDSNLGIYFGASISGGREHVEIYQKIVNHLKRYGNVLTEHIADKRLTSMGETELSDRLIHERDMELLSKAKILTAEVTQASLGVGYELGRIDERNLWVPKDARKNILCLYQPQINKRLSAMIKGSSGINNAEYRSLEEAFYEIDKFFHSLKGN